jgi:hypothetical protein
VRLPKRLVRSISERHARDGAESGETTTRPAWHHKMHFHRGSSASDPREPEAGSVLSIMHRGASSRNWRQCHAFARVKEFEHTRTYSKGASKDVASAMRRSKKGSLKSGRRVRPLRAESR